MIIIKPEPTSEVLPLTSVDVIDEELVIQNETEETELITGDLTENDEIVSEPILSKTEIVQIKAEPFLPSLSSENDQIKNQIPLI